MEGTAWKLLVLESARSFPGYRKEKERHVEMEGTNHTSPNKPEYRRLPGKWDCYCIDQYDRT